MRLPFLFPALALVALAGPARGGHPPVPTDGPTKYKPFTLVRLRADGVDAKAGIVWRVYPSAGVQRATTPRGVLEFVAPPGVYTVERLVIRTGADGTVEVEEWSTQIEIERGCDPVPPAPAPQPPAKPKADPWNALGRIQFGSAGCTATVVYPRLPDGRWQVLTANHCIEHVGLGAKGQMQLRGKTERFAIKVVAADKTSDCAWLVTESADLGELPFALLAEAPAPAGTRIWHGGFGADNPGNREDGTVTRPSDGSGQTELSLSVSSGDSGGGMFRDDTGELISTVCCTAAKGQRARVWGANVDSIRKLRPKPTAAEAPLDDWFHPISIPERPAATGRDVRDWWKPVAMPETARR